MSVEKYLARLSPGQSLELGLGGPPEITREDVLTALGYASRYPADAIGVHLLLARYADDPLSQKILPPRLADVSWRLWWVTRQRGRTSRQAHERLAHLAVRDWVNPQLVRRQGVTWMAKFCKLDHRTWKNKYQPHYANLQTWMSIQEGPVYSRFVQALRRTE